MLTSFMVVLANLALKKYNVSILDILSPESLLVFQKEITAFISETDRLGSTPFQLWMHIAIHGII